MPHFPRRLAIRDIGRCSLAIRRISPDCTCRCPCCRRLKSVNGSRVRPHAPDQNVTNDPTEGTPFESMTNSKYTPGGARLALAGAATVSVFPATVNESGRNR